MNLPLNTMKYVALQWNYKNFNSFGNTFQSVTPENTALFLVTPTLRCRFKIYVLFVVKNASPAIYENGNGLKSKCCITKKNISCLCLITLLFYVFGIADLLCICISQARLQTFRRRVLQLIRVDDLSRIVLLYSKKIKF